MFETILTKENIALAGVISLFVWRIIDFFIRQKKKRENELEKLAFEMAKHRTSDNTRAYQRDSFFSYYLFYLDALEKNMRPYRNNGYEIMKDFDDQLTQKVERLDFVLIKLTEIEEKLKAEHDVTVADLWDRNLTWSMWWRETKKMLTRMVRRKRTFHSLK